MTLMDARGVAASTTRRKSLDGFETALRQLHGYRGDPVATIDAVLADDPDFVLGHLFRAGVLITLWERSIVPDVARALAEVERLAPRANARESSLAAAFRAWADGAWDTMALRLDRHLAEYPRDAFALQVGHIADFIHGDRENLRGRVLRALPAWSRGMPGHGYVLGMLAFGQEECGEYGRAEDTGRRALDSEPEDGWAHHAVTHVMEMQGRQAEGIAWMAVREPLWAQPDNAFAFHNWWHTALFHLDQGRPAAALAIYDRGVYGTPSTVQLVMVDAIALLWRLRLQGVDVGTRWDPLANAAETAAEGGFYAFNDMHAMMALVAAGRVRPADRLLAAVGAAAAGTGTNARMARCVGVTVARAIHAFGMERFGEVVDLLLPVRYRAHAFGGSHAQRDVIHRTLLEAALRDGQSALADALAAERVALKPDCPFARRMAARLQPAGRVA